VGDAVQGSISGQRGRRSERHLVVENWPERDDGLVYDQFLLPGGDVGDVGVLGQVGAGTGRRLDRHVRRQLLPAVRQGARDQPGAKGILDVTAQGAQYLSGLGGVNSAPSAETDDHLRLKFRQPGGDAGQVFAGSVGPRPGDLPHQRQPGGRQGALERLHECVGARKHVAHQRRSCP